MTKTSATTAVGVFAESEQAQRAFEELRRGGFRQDQIGIVTRAGVTVIDEDQKVPEGAALGAAAGAGIGAAVGAALIALPPVGPAIAGGILATVLASAAGGAVVGGFVGALIGMGIPEEQARYYENEFLAGRTLIIVQADDRYGDAQQIMRRHGGYDVDNMARAAANSGAALP